MRTQDLPGPSNVIALIRLLVLLGIRDVLGPGKGLGPRPPPRPPRSPAGRPPVFRVLTCFCPFFQLFRVFARSDHFLPQPGPGTPGPGKGEKT